MKRYAFDFNRLRERELDYNKMNRFELKVKSENIHQDMDEKILLARKFEEDKKLIEEQIRKIYNSDLDYEDKREQLFMLKEMVQVLKDEYEVQVEKEIEKKQEEDLNILKIFQENKEILKEQAEKMGQVQLQSGSVSLNDAIEETKRMEEYFQELQERETQELENRLEKVKVLTKEMHKDRSIRI